MSNRLTDIQIAARIVPTHVRWPKDNKGVWSELHNCVDSFRGLVRRVDENCCQIERETAPREIAVRRNELGTRTLTVLANFSPFESAEKAASEMINSLERQAECTPEQVQMYESLVKARSELHEGVNATRRVVVERCKMRHGELV
jgi:hypothetical protein